MYVLPKCSESHLHVLRMLQMLVTHRFSDFQKTVWCSHDNIYRQQYSRVPQRECPIGISYLGKGVRQIVQNHDSSFFRHQLTCITTSLDEEGPQPPAGRRSIGNQGPEGIMTQNRNGSPTVVSNARHDQKKCLLSWFRNHCERFDLRELLRVPVFARLASLHTVRES